MVNEVKKKWKKDTMNFHINSAKASEKSLQRGNRKFQEHIYLGIIKIPLPHLRELMRKRYTDLNISLGHSKNGPIAQDDTLPDFNNSGKSESVVLKRIVDVIVEVLGSHLPDGIKIQLFSVEGNLCPILLKASALYALDKYLSEIHGIDTKKKQGDAGIEFLKCLSGCDDSRDAIRSAGIKIPVGIVSSFNTSPAGATPMEKYEEEDKEREWLNAGVVLLTSVQQDDLEEKLRRAVEKGLEGILSHLPEDHVCGEKCFLRLEMSSLKILDLNVNINKNIIL